MAYDVGFIANLFRKAISNSVAAGDRAGALLLCQ